MQNKEKGKRLGQGWSDWLWLGDVGPDLGSDVLVEFFLLWQRLAAIALVPE
jgi:hypothetical protein